MELNRPTAPPESRDYAVMLTYYTALLWTVISRFKKEIGIWDVHTHLFLAAFGGLNLWGFDELVTYHYLVAEFFKTKPKIKKKAFFALPKSEQADLIWQALFVERSPVSEACLGVVTTLVALGLSPKDSTPDQMREYFRGTTFEAHRAKIFEISGVRKVTGTDDPLHPDEAPVWERGFDRDPAHGHVCRLDSALMKWPAGVAKIQALGYEVTPDIDDPKTLDELRRFIREQAQRRNAEYLPISLPPDINFRTHETGILLRKAAFPVAEELGIPAALMIGVERDWEPDLELAGDGVGMANVRQLVDVCRAHNKVEFMVWGLSRENQHQLIVIDRKIDNLHMVGFWWFLNNEPLVTEGLSQRFALLGLSHRLQNSDARVWDQLIYKWQHFWEWLVPILAARYARLATRNWLTTEEEMLRDLRIVLPPDQLFWRRN